MNEVRRALERVEVPEEHEARERVWALIRTAWAEREPEPRRLPLRALVALAAVVALVGAALSPPGRAVIEEVREAIGVEGAEPALFSLPSGGRLLVTSERGVWIVQPDGSKRLLGRYREASWSPNGRFVVVARANELAALDPKGNLRWSLARPAVRHPRWTGSASDTRVAYLSGASIRVLAGDGTDDRALGSASRIAPAWRPGPRHVVAYMRGDRRLAIVDADTGRSLGRSRVVEPAAQLEWSSDATHLVAVRPRGLAVYTADGRLRAQRALPGRLGAAAFAPAGGRFAVVRTIRGRSEVLVFDAARLGAPAQRVFSGEGRFTDVVWSPDGRWLLVAWRAADQWVFLRSAGVRRVEAVSRISTQLRSRLFPTLNGWCCPRNTVSLEEKESAGAQPEATPPPPARPSNTVLQGSERAAVVWRRSASFGLPWSGRLENAVHLPAEGARFFTWDPIRKRAPNRGWRRYGSDRLVRMVLRVLGELDAADRIGVGDLSRKNGGDFGVRYGRPGHVSHQNGLDADLYYPRLDGKERPPDRPEQIDRRLAQELVDRFVAAGAVKVFVGPNTGLTGPPDVVQALAHHDNHLHVRIAPAR